MGPRLKRLVVSTSSFLTLWNLWTISWRRMRNAQPTPGCYSHPSPGARNTWEKKLSDDSSVGHHMTATVWGCHTRMSSWVHQPQTHEHRTLFKPLSIGVVCYSTIDNQNNNHLSTFHNPVRFLKYLLDKGIIWNSTCLKKKKRKYSLCWARICVSQLPSVLITLQGN